MGIVEGRNNKRLSVERGASGDIVVTIVVTIHNPEGPGPMFTSASFAPEQLAELVAELAAVAAPRRVRVMAPYKAFTIAPFDGDAWALAQARLTLPGTLALVHIWWEDVQVDDRAGFTKMWEFEEVLTS